MRQLRRILFYLIGQIVLATGLTLSTKVNLGVSPILSIAYCASVITGRAIGDTSLIVYIICIIAEIILHQAGYAAGAKEKGFHPGSSSAAAKSGVYQGHESLCRNHSNPVRHAVP